MRKYIVFILLTYCCSLAMWGQNSENRVRLIFAGDIMGHQPQLNAAQTGNGLYDFSPCYQFVKDYLKSADLAIANLEVTLAGEPYSSYPCFSSPDPLALAACQAGFDILTTANNHCMDKGRKGLERTLSTLDSWGIPHLGTYKNSAEREAKYPLFVEKNGIRIAFLCYTYGTNGISVQSPNIVNYIDSTLILQDMAAAQKARPDYIITLIHWGIEYQTQANAEQEGLARWLMAIGSDLVIGGHPHVVQNITLDIDTTNDRYPEMVVYSMGNLVSNQRDINTDGGIMVEVELEKKGSNTSLYNCAYMPYWVHRGKYNGKYQYYIVPSTDAVEHPGYYQITDDEYKALETFSINTRKRLQTPDSLPLLEERRFYHAGKPSIPLLYTYYDLNYDRDHIDTSLLWVESFAGQSAIYSQDLGGNLIPGYAHEKSYVDLLKDCWHNSAAFEDGEKCHYTSSPFANQGVYRWDTVPSNGPDTRFVTWINSNKIELVTRRNSEDITPLPHYRRLPGVVTQMWRNGQLQLQLARIDTLPIAHAVIPLDKGQRVTPALYSQQKKDKMIITTHIFDNQQLHWGARNLRWSESGPVADTVPDSLMVDGMPCDTTLHFAGGTIIMKRLQLQKLPEHYQLFLELHQHSNGDAYDRAGSVFVIPQDCAKTFFEGMNHHPDSLPLVYSRKGSRFQGIAATSDYLPPVELMRFFTPFGVQHFNDRVRIEGLEWADESYYKQEVTDLAYYLQGDVWIGVFIGNYDGGGHKVTLDLKAYPQDYFWTQDSSRLWATPLFNTCNVLEMAGQNYGRLFDTDSLTVSFCIPENVKDIRLRFISTGHGGWDGGDEFNPKTNTLLVDGEPAFVHTPWRCDCGTYRHLNPVSGNFWNGVSSSDYSRSGWCPGTSTPPTYFDLSWLSPGWHTLTLTIPQGADFEGSFSHWMCSAVLLGNYAK